MPLVGAHGALTGSFLERLLRRVVTADNRRAPLLKVKVCLPVKVSALYVELAIIFAHNDPNSALKA